MADDKCILQITSLNDLKMNFNYINNIKVIGDIHGDLDVLLLYLKKLNLINYNKYKATFKRDVNFNNIMNNFNNIIKNINENNLTNLNLYINENSYINSIELNNNYYDIEFNINEINNLNNTALVFLGDICDTHYYDMYGYTNITHNKNGLISFINDSIYNNDYGCYQVLFILKKLIELKDNNKLIILFGNHEFNVFLDNNISLDDLIRDNKQNYARTWLYYIISPKEILLILNHYWDNDTDFQNFINEPGFINFINKYDELEKERIKYYNYLYYNLLNLYNEKKTKRKEIILNNINNFNYIVSFNKILISHNFLYQEIINRIITNLINNKVNISNKSIVDILESIFKYLLTKKDCKLTTTYKDSINLINNLISHRLGLGNNDFQKYGILCNFTIDENNNYIVHDNSCNDQIHIIGHIPQCRNKIQNKNNSIYDKTTSNKIDDKCNEYKENYSPKYMNFIQNNLLQYHNYYIYMIDYHLSDSFNYPNNENNKYHSDNNDKYYLNININEQNITKEFIKFNTEQTLIRPREEIIQDEQDNQIKKIKNGGYKLFL